MLLKSGEAKRQPAFTGRWPWRVGILLAVVILALSGTMSETALACPNCKDTLAEGGANAMNLVRGYFWSILFMMSMPFLILGTLISYFYYEVCKARAREAGNLASSSSLGRPSPPTGQSPPWSARQSESLA